MRLNPRTCKELRVRYFREPPILSPLTIGGTPLEVVNSHNVLGVHINSKLKWSDHVEEITKKGAKRLNILRILRQSGLSSDELVSIHVTLISSILEYRCSVWHTSLPSYLSDKIERIQKRALSIIYPHLSYREVLKETNCPRLEDNRQRLCSKVLILKRFKMGTVSWPPSFPKTELAGMTGFCSTITSFLPLSVTQISFYYKLYKEALERCISLFFYI